jgi:hypothetical protein
MHQAEVLFEMTVVGSAMKVVAMDAATGVEVAVMGPAYASGPALRMLALAKLKARLAQNDNR